MIRNYLKIALRNLQKQKVITFINVFGLSAGIACFVLLLLFSANELSFDKFHKNGADVYRLYVWNEAMAGNPAIGYTDYSGPTPMPIGDAMKRDLPGVKNVVRLQLPWGENLVRTYVIFPPAIFPSVNWLCRFQSFIPKRKHTVVLVALVLDAI